MNISVSFDLTTVCLLQYLRELGKPSSYKTVKADLCCRFELFNHSEPCGYMMHLEYVLGITLAVLNLRTIEAVLSMGNEEGCPENKV